jgi:hypothetical protein
MGFLLSLDEYMREAKKSLDPLCYKSFPTNTTQISTSLFFICHFKGNQPSSYYKTTTKKKKKKKKDKKG